MGHALVEGEEVLHQFIVEVQAYHPRTVGESMAVGREEAVEVLVVGGVVHLVGDGDGLLCHLAELVFEPEVVGAVVSELLEGHDDIDVSCLELFFGEGEVTVLQVGWHDVLLDHLLVVLDDEH